MNCEYVNYPALGQAPMPCADSSTICARRQVTTDPVPRRMIRSNRCPSSSSISRTRTRSATRTASRIRAVRSSIRTARHITTGQRLLDTALGRPGRVAGAMDTSNDAAQFLVGLIGRVTVSIPSTFRFLKAEVSFSL